jgi:DNA (cytosine-5)-methyltransferase 1
MLKPMNYLKITEAAAFVGVEKETLRNWERSKKISVYRDPISSHRLYKKEDLEELLKKILPQ